MSQFADIKNGGVTVVRLDRRPLFGTRGDASLYVESVEDERALRSLVLGLNVLVHGEHGSGRTSLVMHAGWSFRQSDVNGVKARVHHVPAAGALTAEGVLRRLIALVEGVDVRRGDGHLGDVDAIDLVGRLREAVARRRWRSVLVVDDVTPTLGRSLFGSLRDELWTIDAGWMVTCLTSDVDVLLLPPVDTFFETVVETGEMSSQACVEMARRRLGTDDQVPALLSDADLQVLTEAARHRPRRLLDLVRSAVVDGESVTALVARGRVDSRLETLTPGGLSLFYEVEFYEVETAGALGPSDPSVQARSGLSRPRLVQLFHELRDAGLVDEVTAPSDGPGRPRVLYRLRPLLPDRTDDEEAS